MQRAVQFSVGLDNSAGTLARLCSMLRKAKVNIDALSVSDNADCGWIRLVATPAAKARKALDKAGYTVCARLVLVAEAPNEPGELERMCTRLAKAGVNIHYIYGSAAADAESHRLVLGVDDVDGAIKALG